jgi:hypothetical protein
VAGALRCGLELERHRHGAVRRRRRHRHRLGASGLLGATDATGAWNDYGIGAAQLAVLEPGVHALGSVPALALNAGYAALFLALGVLVARRTDV